MARHEFGLALACWLLAPVAGAAQVPAGWTEPLTPFEIAGKRDIEAGVRRSLPLAGDVVRDILFR